MQMLRTFAKDAFRFGLTSWRWSGIAGKTPRFTTCFGDVFLESLEGWWFLDTMEGTLELRWSTAVDMYAELESAQGRATYLMDDLVRDAEQRGMRLGPKDIFTFSPHPALGGDMTADQLTTMRFALALNWAGTMHEQLRYAQPAPPRLTQAPDPQFAREPAHSSTPTAARWVPESGPLQVDTAHPAYAEPHPPTGSFAVTGPYDHTVAARGAHAAYETRYDAGYDTGTFPHYDTGTFPHYDQQAAAHDARPVTGAHHAEPYSGQHAAAAPLDAPRPYVQAGDPPAWDDIWRR